MEQYIRISNINDFLFCPKALYLSSVFEGYDRSLFEEAPQVIGKQLHAAVDERRYSSSKHILQGLPVASTEYGLLGKIDTFDTKKHALIERKTLVKKIYEGYRLQLYAQYVALTEMGYNVMFLYIHSMQDNKRYAILPPNAAALDRLSEVLRQMRELTPDKIKHHHCQRCDEHIYGGLAW